MIPWNITTEDLPLLWLKSRWVKKTLKIIQKIVPKKSPENQKTAKKSCKKVYFIFQNIRDAMTYYYSQVPNKQVYLFIRYLRVADKKNSLKTFSYWPLRDLKSILTMVVVLLILLFKNERTKVEDI